MRNDLKKNYFDYLTGCNLKKSTIKRMKSQLNQFFNWNQGRDVRDVTAKKIKQYYDYLNTYISQYGRPLHMNTIKSGMGTVKHFFQFLFLQELILVNPFEFLDFNFTAKNKKKSIFSQEEINTLLDSISIDQAEQQRDRAYFELLYSSGLRFNESISLEMEDINFTDRILLVKVGKGGKSRYIPFSETALQYLIYYVKHARKEHIRKTGEKKLLFPGPNGGKLSHKMMSKRLKKYLGEELKDKYTIHSFRHTCATHLLESGAGIRYVQELLGHENITSTEIYAHPSQEKIRSIYKTYHPRENEYYLEVDDEYLQNIDNLYNKLK